MADTEAKARGNAGCAIVAGLISLSILAFLLYAANSSENETSRTDGPTITTSQGPVDRWLAYTACQNQVEKRLKAPSTAQFMSAAQAPAPTMANNTWNVTVIVDAQNSFGAMIRSQWSCIIDGDADTVAVREL